MATPAQTPTLAQTIKSKYPGVYDDMDDAALEQKVLAKYPQYADMPRTQMPKSTAKIGAAPTGVLPWLQNLEGDIRYGSNMTGPGKFLHSIGMQPTSAGVPEGVEQKMASPVLGPIKMAQGAAQIPDSPWQGVKTAAAGALQTADLPMSFMAPEMSEAPALGARAARGATAVKGAGEGIENVLAKLLRQPATAAQSQAGQAGKVKNILPPFLQKWTVPESVIPKGTLGSATNPGPFVKIPTKVPQSILSEAEEAASQAEPGARTFPKPMRPLIGTPEEWNVYEQQMKILKSEASDAGTYSAARGKVGKKLDYQQRIKKDF